MTISEQIAHKTRLKQRCLDIIGERVRAAEILMNNAQDAANNEEKSSAGDKYETGRAMGHLEKEMHGRQLAENIKELAQLRQINTGVVYTGVTQGAFVRCAQVSFFIAAGLGKQIVDDLPVIFLSPHAPLAGALLNKNQGDTFYFKGVPLVIIEVY